VVFRGQQEAFKRIKVIKTRYKIGHDSWNWRCYSQRSFTTLLYTQWTNTCAAISRGLPEPTKKMPRVTRCDIPPGITKFILSFYVILQNACISITLW